MTTTFKSFDASLLGAFVESPLGVRNRRARALAGRPIVVAVVWLDESTAYNDPVFSDDWVRDSMQWGELVSVIDRSKFVAAVFDAPVAVGSPLVDAIIPPGATFPPAVRLVDVARTPSASTILGYFRALIESQEPVTVTEIWFFLDRSGSMMPEDLEPAFGQFLDLLGEEFADQAEQPAITVREFVDERWLWRLWGTISVIVPR